MKFGKQKPDTRETVREVIEVEVERLGVTPTRMQVWTKRALGFVKPTILGALVDVGDLVTPTVFAPIVLPIGMLVGFLFASMLDAPPTWRVLIAASVGVYWIIPFTSPVPIAAVLAAIVYIFRPDVMERDPVLDRP